MANNNNNNVLSLVDLLMNSVFQKNIFTDQNTFLSTVRPLPQSPINPAKIVPTAPGPLAVSANAVGSSIDPNLSVDIPAFLNTSFSPSPQSARETPAALRQKIYYPNNTPPLDIAQQTAVISTRPSFLIPRDQIYADNKPPTPNTISQLTVDNASTFIPADQNIKNNLYNDGPPSFISQGGHSTLSMPGGTKFFDVLAIAHWLRNVASEVYFAPKFTNDPVSKQGKFVGPNTETITKSALWLSNNLFLASLNKGDPQSYGLGNLVWNPLSFPTALLPGARGIVPTDRPTVRKHCFNL